MLTGVQYRILRKIAPTEPNNCSGSAYEGKSKLAAQLGDGIFARTAGKVVIDFGCGEGVDAVEMAAKGAGRVIGIDNREDVLKQARNKARQAGVEEKCSFAFSAAEPADVIVSLDSFEHFADPAGVLGVMGALLKPGGEVLVAFGPTWYHPSGGHLFSVFPWAHLLFNEQALTRWRSHIRNDGATRFSEVAGGLNQMTVARFEELVAASTLKFASCELVPIRKLRRFHNRLTREFTTSIVRCRLVKRGLAHPIIEAAPPLRSLQRLEPIFGKLTTGEFTRQSAWRPGG